MSKSLYSFLIISCVFLSACSTPLFLRSLADAVTFATGTYSNECTTDPTTTKVKVTFTMASSTTTAAAALTYVSAATGSGAVPTGDCPVVTSQTTLACNDLTFTAKGIYTLESMADKATVAAYTYTLPTATKAIKIKNLTALTPVTTAKSMDYQKKTTATFVVSFTTNVDTFAVPEITVTDNSKVTVKPTCTAKDKDVTCTLESAKVAASTTAYKVKFGKPCAESTLVDAFDLTVSDTTSPSSSSFVKLGNMLILLAGLILF